MVIGRDLDRPSYRLAPWLRRQAAALVLLFWWILTLQLLHAVRLLAARKARATPRSDHAGFPAHAAAPGRSAATPAFRAARNPTGLDHHSDLWPGRLHARLPRIDRRTPIAGYHRSHRNRRCHAECINRLSRSHSRYPADRQPAQPWVSACPAIRPRDRRWRVPAVPEQRYPGSGRLARCTADAVPFCQ